MILCVAPSPAWDLTLHVDRLHEHATNRARSSSARAGGKAVNVARVLHQLGEDVAVLAPLGGTTGGLMRADLEGSGIRVEVVPDEHETRRTVAIVSDETGDTTIVNEPAVLTDWRALLARFEELVPHADVVVASGSLPEGAPVDAFAQLVLAAAGVPVVVDTSGPALAAALGAGPTLVKPNAHELSGLADASEPAVAASALARTSGSAVAVSLGGDGMVLAVGDETWHASGPPLRGNPVGAGDAAVASFAAGLHRATPWPDILVDAVATSAAAVLAPYAGELPADHARLRAQVVVSTVEPVR